MDEILSRPSIQGIGFFVVAVLLAFPYVGKLLGTFLPGLLPPRDRQEFTKQTVVELIALRGKLEKYGPPQAAKLCKELTVTLIAGETYENR
jgi:hypothetical protein